MNKITQLGQVFTPEATVDLMLNLIKNDGSFLEPSCGNGRFYNKLKNCVGIEFDENYCPDGCLNMDFFEYSSDNKFDTIIGNPPYVRGKEILPYTKNNISKYFNHTKYDNSKTNLYIIFIFKCLDQLKNNGELIFITPREFIKQTNSIELNTLIYNSGTITHFYDLGDDRIFGKYTPNCAIWRFEKDNFSRKTIINSEQIVNFKLHNGQLLFNNNEDTTISLSDIVSVKVGGVSGMDEIFTNINGNMDFVCSYTSKTNTLKKMFFYTDSTNLNQVLLLNREILINRKIKKFNNTDWWQWGRKFYMSNEKRIYVNSKTRNEFPFFVNECNNWDGSILALFPKNSSIDINELLSDLNNVDWGSIGFKVGGRFIFSQKGLQDTMLPSHFNKYI